MIWYSLTRLKIYKNVDRTWLAYKYLFDTRWAVERSIFIKNVSVKNSDAEPISDKFQLEMNKLLDFH